MYRQFCKAKLRFSVNFVLVVICSQFFISCVNGLPDETYMPGDIPITIHTSLKKITKTRISDSKFENGEQIGLYVTIPPSTLQNTRYIENMRFTYNGENGFVPDETVFFPEGNNSCDFTSYHPYCGSGISKGSGIEVEIQTDQSNLQALSASDFMTATVKGVKATVKPVDLQFSHKLFCMNIQLKVQSGYTLQSLLDANPEVRIKDVYTKATYDFNTDAFTNLNTRKDVIPHGTWSIKDDMLCGKSVIIIPQTLSKSHIIIELYVGDQLFECAYDQEYTLASGVAEDNIVTLISSSDATKSTIRTSINDWTTGENAMEAKEKSSVIEVSQLDFSVSNVLKIISKEKQVAEICKEYLCTDDIETQAIVIYPTVDGKTDLTKGMVIELLGETNDKHRGSVSWDRTNNTLTYNEGTESVPAYIYITPDGEIRTTRPANALQLQLKPDVLTDVRGSETIKYAIAKIGVQYWMRINFKATKYIDGTEIELGSTTVNNAIAQYYNRSNTYYFYNAAAIASGKLISDGWRIGNETDYSRLKTYIRNNASVLKNGASWSDGNYETTNLTGFNAVASGYYKPTYTFNKKYAAYWCSNNNVSNSANRMVTLYIEDNEVKIENVTNNSALIIKCVRE